MERLMKKCGADRVSDDAKAALSDVIMEFAEEICRKAIRLAKHGGRITIKKEDIKLAART